MKTITEFIEDFEEQLVDNDMDITPAQNFRELDCWDSLTAMAVIAMIGDKYGIKISDEMFSQISTIEELYNYIVNENS